MSRTGEGRRAEHATHENPARPGTQRTCWNCARPDKVVSEVRAELAKGVPDGLTVLVTGPGGQIADLVVAFGGIDGLLLLVAGLVVVVILVVVYRSPLLPLIVLLSAVFALGVAAFVVYQLAEHDVLTLNGQSQGILFILVFGAATDYALLMVARFREELRETVEKPAKPSAQAKDQASPARSAREPSETGRSALTASQPSTQHTRTNPNGGHAAPERQGRPV